MIILAFLGMGAVWGPGMEPSPHLGNNPVFVALVRDGIDLGGVPLRLPQPLLDDGQSVTAQQAALLELAGSEQAREDLLRDSITAPFILRVHDLRAKEGIIRQVDLWFVVRASLEGIDPMQVAAQASGRSVGAGNMEFEQRLLTAEELKARDKVPLAGRELSRWFTHVQGRLLDRIELAATSEVVASRTVESLIIASRTDRDFDAAGPFANRWRAVRPGGRGPDLPCVGGVSYARIGRLRQPEGTLLVEVHAAFMEPEDWFQGAPILRSKFAPIAQDQIRRLRRELRNGRAKASGSR